MNCIGDLFMVISIKLSYRILNFISIKKYLHFFTHFKKFLNSLKNLIHIAIM